MKHIELINCERNTKAGNHRVEFTGAIGHFFYYATEIVTVDYVLKTFSVIQERISVSTSCAIGKYRNELIRQGFKEVAELC